VDGEFGVGDTVEVHNRDDAAHYSRKLDQFALFEIFGLQRHVGGAEGYGARRDLLDAAAGADRLIVQADAGFFLIGVRPFGVGRIWKGRAGAGDIGGACLTRERGARNYQSGGKENGCEAHRWLPCSVHVLAITRMPSRSRVYEG